MAVRAIKNNPKIPVGRQGKGGVKSVAATKRALKDMGTGTATRARVKLKSGTMVYKTFSRGENGKIVAGATSDGV